MSVKISARVSEDIVNIINSFSGKDFTEKLVNTVLAAKYRTEKCVDSTMSDRSKEVSDVKAKVHDEYKYRNEISYLKYELETRISIFDESYNYYNLGSFLMNLEFIEKFRKDINSYWKNTREFEMLYERLKDVYRKAYSAEQEEENK